MGRGLCEWAAAMFCRQVSVCAPSAREQSSLPDLPGKIEGESARTDRLFEKDTA